MYPPYLVTKDNLKFKDYPDRLTQEMLEKAYPGRCRMFDSEKEAQAFADKQEHAWITRTFDYKLSDFNTVIDPVSKRVTGVVLKPNAKKIYTGWLVSMVAVSKMQLVKKKKVPQYV